MTIAEELAFEAGVLVEKLSAKYKIPHHQALIYGAAGLELLSRASSLHVSELRAGVQSLLERLYREDQVAFRTFKEEQNNEDNA